MCFAVAQQILFLNNFRYQELTMSPTPFQKQLLPLIAALSLITSAQAAEVTSTIAGVADAGTAIEFIKDGFEGTEGPITLPDGSALFTETKANRITRIAADNSISSFLENTGGANGLAFASNGDLYAVQQAAPAKVAIIYPKGREKVLAENFAGAPFQRLNDLVLAKNGGVYFTDIGTRPSPENPNPPASKAGLFYISPTGQLKQLANDIERPNGVQLSLDEKTLFVANTSGEYILAYDIAADGSISNQRDFAKLQGWSETNKVWSSGADGLALDAEGRLYVASNAGVEVFDEDGDALGVIGLPHKPQNLAFAGKDKKTLYVVGRGAAYKIALKTAGFAGRAK
jgi:gluconolactonase